MKKEYEKGLVEMNDTINKQNFEIAELRYENNYLEKRLYDKIYDAAFNQEPLTQRSVESPKKSESGN